MKRQTLAHRVVTAFTLMTLMIGGVLSLGIVFAVHYSEKAILTSSFKQAIARISEDLRQGKEPHLDEDTRFFVFGSSDQDIPPAFRNARIGFSEVKDEGRDYWVYVHRDEESGVRYLVLRDQEDFEKHEQILWMILCTGLLATILGAFVLGRLLARQVISPVSRLSEQVRGLPVSVPGAPLAKDYANDEVGHLAHAFDEVFARLRFAIEKERLFTSDVSHELRTPLMIISTSCELLLSSADLTMQGREQIKRIACAAREMQELSETFLALARAELGKEVCQDDSEGVSLNALAKEESAQWAELAAAKGLTFELREEKEDKGRYHAVLLRVLMGNLLRNAIYYTERGWIRLTLEESGFQVEDSGMGIPDTEKDGVFQSFTRGTRARGEGQGLGLSLVRRIAGQQTWQVSLENLPEGGSRFRVRLGKESTRGME
ncbi:MAG: HAMP domain-containing histidine kinase [Betaproteobacteria bacterium]|nr:HAMP domain-containing histidine kinase [Betaproteobacteria bacterium]